MNLELDKILKNENGRVLIAGPGIGIRAMLTEDFSVGGANNFESIFEIVGQSGLQKFLLLSGAGAKFLGMESIGTALEDYRLMNFEQSDLAWMSSEFPEFSVKVIIVNLRAGDDVREPVRQLMKATYPSGTPSIGKTEQMQAPLGYSPTGPAGTVAVSIGKWFRMTPVVIRRHTFNFSQQVVSDGSPLYAVGSITFKPYQMPSSGTMVQALSYGRGK